MKPPEKLACYSGTPISYQTGGAFTSPRIDSPVITIAPIADAQARDIVSPTWAFTACLSDNNIFLSLFYFYGYL